MNSGPSAFEKLSFTKNQNFSVGWEAKLKEISLNLKLEAVENGELESFQHDWIEYLELKEIETPHSRRQLYFSSSLEIYWLAESNTANSNLDSTDNFSQIAPEDYVALRCSELDILQEELYLESDLFLLKLLAPFFKSTEKACLKVEPPLAVSNFLVENLAGLKKLMFIDRDSSGIIFVVADLQFRLSVVLSEDGKTWRIWGEYFSESSNFVLDLWQVKSPLISLIITNQNKIYSLSQNSQLVHIYSRYMAAKGPLLIPQEELAKFFYQLFNQVGFCECRLDSKIRLEKSSLVPQNIFYLKTVNANLQSVGQIEGQVWFRYDKFEIPAHCHRTDKRFYVISYKQFYDPVTELFGIHLFTPDEDLENAATQKIREQGGVSFDLKKNVFKIEFALLHQLIGFILESVVEVHSTSSSPASTWEVWAENLRVKLLNHYQMFIRTLDVGFKLEFQDTQSSSRIESWQLIHILKKKSAFVKLDDGTLGVLPQTWLAELARLLDNTLEAGIFSASSLFQFLNGENDFNFGVDGDENFRSTKEKLRDQLSGNSPSPIMPGQNFNGVLFDYQRHGLGWLVFLDEFGLGGLLADDMGLGKTIQVLAFLDYVKFEKPNPKIEFPTLLIAPKSVVAQWQDSAKKFTPQLKVKILTPKDINNISDNTYPDSFMDNDILVTSYGVLRRYIKQLQKLSFERVILDEAQLIKNERSLVSIAAKMLPTQKRLALSGTPIENHLADFFSIFQFLNPRMLSSSLLASGNEDELKKMFNKVKPLVLHRKKEDVLQNLPKKTEEVLYLTLYHEQRELYDKIKNYYSEKLNAINEVSQFNEYKIFFLEGLLRLRQICCDPRMIYSPNDTSYKLNSIKTDFVVKELVNLNNSENKVLVFSQFTSFLKIIRTDLEALNIPLVYLDGQTQDRKTVIEDFQNRAELKIFLIGLKAGGLGLNLTAANHCYVLDPWWNPAVEAQAVDRIHRIGQLRNVFVRRLIAKDTLEEKMRDLQKLKLEQSQYLKISDKEFLSSLSLQDFKDLFS
jgi:SNF2 family DNA or RNA helicase